MTKLRWDRAKGYEPDPGAVVKLPDIPIFDNWIPPFQKRELTEKRRIANNTLLIRSQVARYKALARKYGKDRAMCFDYDIPLSKLFEEMKKIQKKKPLSAKKIRRLERKKLKM